MLCEACGEAEANVHLMHEVNNVVRNVHLCEECASKNGINMPGPISLTDILLEPGTLEEDALPGKSCAFCRMQLADFKRTSRLGCPVCYDTFGPELNRMLSGMQKGSRHVGKVPARAGGEGGENLRVSALQHQLGLAVESENYEEAAKLRDEICVEKAKGELDKKARSRHEGE